QELSVSGSSTTTASPGIYSTISVSGNAKLTLKPGYYVITDGVSVSGSGVLVGTGVTIYLACSDYPQPCATATKGAGLSVTGSGQVNLSKGAIGPGAGFSILADSNNEAVISVTGSGTLNVTGFCEAAGVSFQANGHASVSVDGGGIVVDTASATGSAKIIVDEGILGVP
ncbi:MAG: hypothetical protein ACYCOU_23500, partial [Sulfobacillus sp.]